jgi:hypothetical protein
MGASFLEQDSYEFRWTIATLAALTCCAITLSAVTVLWTTGDRFDYRPASSELSPSDDDLVQAFAALRAIEAKQESLPRSPENPPIASDGEVRPWLGQSMILVSHAISV